MRVEFPSITMRRWRAILFVAALATFVRIMLQPLIPAGESQAEPSAISDSGLLIPVFTIYAFVSYIVMCYAFVMIEASLPWSRFRKGILFGSMLGLIWVAYLYEPVPLGEGTPFLESLAYPIADGSSVLVLGILLGRFVATDTTGPLRKPTWKINAMLLVPVTMVVARLFEYNIVHIYSSYANHTLETIAWVALTGVCISVAYIALRAGIPSATPAGRSIAFGVFFYGIPIALVNFFVAVALKINIADLALRSSSDVVAVVVGIFLAEVWARPALEMKMPTKG